MSLSFYLEVFLVSGKKINHPTMYSHVIIIYVQVVLVSDFDGQVGLHDHIE